jgi:hypothetical protein
MLFFFKRKKIILDAFTNNINYYNFARPEIASKFLPEWWKYISGHFTQVNDYGMMIERDTIKSCPGFVDHYKQGFMIPLWSDLNIETDEDGSYKYFFAGAESNDDPNYKQIVSHPASQYGYQLENKIHLKINTPWSIVEKTGVRFVCVEPTWSYIDKNFDMTILPGNLQFQVNTSTNVNIFLPKKSQSIHLDYGMPLYHIIPMSENDIEFKYHLVDNETYKNLKQWSTYKFKFRKNYSFRKKIIKECPFTK